MGSDNDKETSEGKKEEFNSNDNNINLILANLENSKIKTTSIKEISTSSVYYYIPENIGKIKYGIIFYPGTFIIPYFYKNLITILASRGYIICMSTNLMANILFSKSEKNTNEIINKYPDVQFFLAGHSQGGGAAVKIAKIMGNQFLGVILLSPLSYKKDSFEDKNLPTIYFEAENDKVLSKSMKEESKTTVPENTEFVFLKGCNHMGYSNMSFFDGKCTIGVENQQKLVAGYILRFIESVILNK